MMRTNQPQQPAHSVYFAIGPVKYKRWLNPCQAFLFPLLLKEPSNAGDFFFCPVMKLFVVVALCCSFFSTRATPLPFEFSDCDDPDVLEAVDTALQKYNGDRATGNQFALYMVMEAKRTVSRLCKKAFWNCLCALNQICSIWFTRDSKCGSKASCRNIYQKKSKKWLAY